MIDFKQEVAELLADVIDDLTAEELYQMIEYPKYTSMGDFAFPCFRLAKVFRKAPNVIADELVEKLGQADHFENIEAVSGYVNFMVDKGVFAKAVLEEVLDKKDQYGSDILGNGKNIIVEYSSTNIAKPFHMGHIRSTMIGESLNRIYRFLGYNTTSINHLGDYGTQFGKLIVAFKLWGDRAAIEANPIPELLKIYVKFHEEAEVKPELEDEARGWFTKLENNDAEAYELWSWFREVSLKEFNRVYDMLGVHFDSYAGESFYSDKMPAVLTEMREKNIMQKSEGAEIVDLEA
ncbi:MAG: arginine--tRNA ligase, partial [Clostridia bacterium]|nr:arginine--tRNA ligase [Clostridia bacterium]